MENLTSILQYVVAPIVVAEGIALIWIWRLDEEWDGLETKIDLSALDQLNIIIGFLYINLIRSSREKWERIVKSVNEFIITAGTLIEYEPSFKEFVRTIHNQLENYILDENNTKKHVLELKNLTKSVFTLVKASKNKDNITQQLTVELKRHVENLDRHYFEGEPFLFTIHLRVLLGLYFAAIPVHLLNNYGWEGTLIIYPIMIYLLFAVVLWSKAFHNPLKHPKIVPKFNSLKSELNLSFDSAKPLSIRYTDNEKNSLFRL